jgi:hypothetical protein
MTARAGGVTTVTSAPVRTRSKRDVKDGTEDRNQYEDHQDESEKGSIDPQRLGRRGVGDVVAGIRSSEARGNRARDLF